MLSVQILLVATTAHVDMDMKAMDSIALVQCIIIIIYV